MYMVHMAFHIGPERMGNLTPSPHVTEQKDQAPGGSGEFALELSLVDGLSG